MLHIVHNIEEFPSRFETSTYDIEDTGTLIVYDRAGQHAIAAFAPGVWAGVQVV